MEFPHGLLTQPWAATSQTWQENQPSAGLPVVKLASVSEQETYMLHVHVLLMFNVSPQRNFKGNLMSAHRPDLWPMT